MKILLLEDDAPLSEVICEYLEDQGYDVDTAYNGEEAMDKSYESHYDLYVFDVNVPAIKGFDLLKTLRDNSDTTPAIFITSLDSIDDVSEGFESGCDDYLKKPFELAELMLRIKNIQKRTFAATRSDVITIYEGLKFDIDKERLLTPDGPIALPNKELKALKHFLKNEGKIVTFEELFEVMWEYEEEPSMESLRAHMKNLRQKLGHDLIKNIRGTGYRFESESKTDLS